MPQVVGSRLKGEGRKGEQRQQQVILTLLGNVRSCELQATTEHSQWTVAVIENNNRSIKVERTTLGLKGGVIFLALRSSQLIGEKNTWFLISIWKRSKP